ncbi:cytochrome P450 72A15-like isoform X2 [Phoenix dactylifera]|uniref:Cytochrome P450 72A15-like isoform X2 n=1 Tax=Phoenix dactylifera TaxID=42345 RepID=A0A8B9A4D9_PHODC|nr:cytochrome P450 72A15-like isoform X2 [Phoenix dactylifera]
MGLGSVGMVGSMSWGAVGLLLLVVSAVRALEWVWWRPRRLERVLRAQGIKGTHYRFLHGDLKDTARLSNEARSKPLPLSHCIAPRVLPFLHQIINDHGNIVLSWFGPYPRVILKDPELVREVFSKNKFALFEKPTLHPLGHLLVRGIINYDGEKWAKHRRIINPAFHLEKLKCMLPTFSSCCDELIKRWDMHIGLQGSGELDVWPEFQGLTGDVISRAAFGSSFKEGQRIFQLLEEQAELLMKVIQNVYIPGFRFFPTKTNNRMKEIHREIRALLSRMIEQRESAMRKAGAANDDLLGLLIESNFRYSQEQGGSKNTGMTKDDVIEECKLFYFAGHETTTVLLTWTVVVLGMHPSWQARAREEVLQIFGKNKPDFDSLSQLKIVTMILYEVLRLYPPPTFLLRKTYKEVKLGDFSFPPGVQLLLPLLFLHHDPEFWGEDAGEFNPERFASGVSKASKVQGAFFPFGAGPRICVGQNFAMMEVKLALAAMLQHFSFETSSSYAHAPYNVITLHPQYGAQIVLHRL